MRITSILGLSVGAICLLLSSACRQENENWASESRRPDLLHESMQGITDIIVYDIFSPPQAARIYAYASVAAYEAALASDSNYTTLVGQLNDLTEIPRPETGVDYAFDLASCMAALKVGKALTFSEDRADLVRDSVLRQFEKIRMPEEIFARSVAYGEAVGTAVLAWSTKDNYLQLRTAPKYSVTEEEGRWRPTPPDFMDGVEPHWGKIRSFVLDSGQQCRPLPPPKYDMTAGSAFHNYTLEVYHALDSATEDRKAIAAFWDCNPFVSHHQGHVMFATKKISPGGHWMGIAKEAAQRESLTTIASAEVYTLVSISLLDGFISCWDEKYRSNVIRPETVINAYVDPDWVPLLQTPPFPEYTSGHSVISRAAATAMTSVFGEDYAYVDSVEIGYGLPPRSFASFYAASEEAAISRLYGGIHYMPAITEGMKQGQRVGDIIVEQVQMRRSPSVKSQLSVLD